MGSLFKTNHPIFLSPFLLTIWIVCGCATLNPKFETPAVNVTTIRPVESEGLSPKFEIGLHIVNPNRSQIKLHGAVCTLEIEGYDLLTGVSNDLPTIDGYGEADVVLTATASLMKSIQLFADLFNQQRERIGYKLKAKLDLGGLYPNVHIEEKGEFDLSSFSQKQMRLEE